MNFRKATSTPLFTLLTFVPFWAIMLALAGCSEAPAPGQASSHDPKQAPAPATDTANDEPYEVIQSLWDFDGDAVPADVETEFATATRMGGDNGALELKFSPDAKMSIVRLRPDDNWDWSGLDEVHIAVDIHNPGEDSVQLYLSTTQRDALTGNRDGSSNRSTNLAPGESGTYYAVLDGKFIDIDSGFKYSSPPPWETEDEMFIFRYGQRKQPLQSIGEIAFFVRGTLVEKTIVIDNIRLRRNPEYDTSYLQAYVDEFGQNAKQDFPIKVHSLEELQQAARDELADLAANGRMADRTKWNGWKDGPKLEATGYFRTQKVGDKWWLVDPDGHLFWSNGLANVRMANLFSITGIDFRDESVREIDPEEVTPEDSIGTVYVSEQARESRYVASDVRHNMFTWLPEYDDPLADHYSYRRSVIMGAIPHGETFSFYRANLERRYGETEPQSYIRKWEEVTLDRQLSWGFTSFGNWVDPAFYPNEKVPYFANGWIIGEFKTLSSQYDIWAPMPDPFDPEFVRRAEITISTIADEIQGSPWCVGVFVDNEKSWGRSEGTVEQKYGIMLDGVSKDAAESPAKAAFTQLMKDKYSDIAALNASWGTSLASWDEMAAGVTVEEYTEGFEADLSLMLEALSEEYFRVVHDTLEKHLPNHLYMGARMASWGMPPETVKASIKYSDVLSFNIYQEGIQPHAWSFLTEIDLPTIIGEWHIGSISDTGLWHPGLVHAADQADRAQMWTEYLESVMALPTFVGAHWFQYVDSPISGRAFDGENYNVGFVSGTDIPYPEMIEAARKFNSTLYTDRYGK